MRMDIAQRIRTLVPAREAAEHYGFTINRTGFIRCPFHDERTASLKFFDDGGWFCFGCHAGGSSIDFVMRLFDLDFRRALVRLDLDFSLGLTGEKPDHSARSERLRKRRMERQRRREIEPEIQSLSAEHLRLHQALIHRRPDGPGDGFDPVFVEALKRLPELQWRLDELENELGRLERGARETA